MPRRHPPAACAVGVVAALPPLPSLHMDLDVDVVALVRPPDVLAPTVVRNLVRDYDGEQPWAIVGIGIGIGMSVGMGVCSVQWHVLARPAADGPDHTASAHT